MGYAAERASQIGRRTEQRFPTRIAAVVSSDGGPIFAVVEDVSAYGAKVEAVLLDRIGARVSIRGVALDVSGTVVWRERDKCGVKFDKPIDALEVARRNALLHVDRGATSPIRFTKGR